MENYNNYTDQDNNNTPPAPETPTPGTPSPGTPSPGTPTPGTPASGSPTPWMPAPGAPVPGTPAPNKTNNLAVVSMIVGIFGLVFCCFPPLQFSLGVAGIVLVIFSKRGKPWSGFAIAGLVLSILSLLISLAVFAYGLKIAGMMKDPQYAPLFNDVYEMFEMYETMPIQ